MCSMSTAATANAPGVEPEQRRSRRQRVATRNAHRSLARGVRGPIRGFRRFPWSGVDVSPPAYVRPMNDVLIEGEPIELLQEAFRGMKARREADGWVSVTGRLDRVPGEALLRALQRAEASLPRRLGHDPGAASGGRARRDRPSVLGRVGRCCGSVTCPSNERATRATWPRSGSERESRARRHLELVPVDE